MNSKAAQLTENGQRLSVCSHGLRWEPPLYPLWLIVWLMGPYGAKNVSWGDFAHFVEYTGAVMSLFPSSLTVSFCLGSYRRGDTLWNIALREPPAAVPKKKKLRAQAREKMRQRKRKGSLECTRNRASCGAVQPSAGAGICPTTVG